MRKKVPNVEFPGCPKGHFSTLLNSWFSNPKWFRECFCINFMFLRMKSMSENNFPEILYKSNYFLTEFNRNSWEFHSEMAFSSIEILRMLRIFSFLRGCFPLFWDTLWPESDPFWWHFSMNYWLFLTSGFRNSGFRLRNGLVSGVNLREWHVEDYWHFCQF